MHQGAEKITRKKRSPLLDTRRYCSNARWKRCLTTT